MPFAILSILMALIVAAVPVAAVLGILSLSLDELFMRGRRSLMLGDFVWEQSIEYILVAIPMFILLGEIMLRAGIALRMYNAVIQWLSWLPGGLMHANIGSCAIFAVSVGVAAVTSSFFWSECCLPTSPRGPRRAGAAATPSARGASARSSARSAPRTTRSRSGSTRAKSASPSA